MRVRAKCDERCNGVFLDFLHQAAEKVRRVDCSAPSGGKIRAIITGRGKRDVHNVELAKAEAIAIHRETTPNDEIG